MLALLPTLYSYILSVFSALFAPTVVSKCEIRNQGVHEDYISWMHILLDLSIFIGRAKMKIAIGIFFQSKVILVQLDE